MTPEKSLVEHVNEMKVHDGALILLLVEKGILTDADCGRLRDVLEPMLRAKQDQMKAKAEAEARAASPLYALMSTMMKKIEEAK